MSLKTTYTSEIRPKLATSLGITSTLALPRLEKIVVHVGIGSLRQVPKITELVVRDLSLITGQKPVLRRAKQAVAAFKLRAGEIVGVAVTLRGERMYEFLERLIHVVLPRIRDFRGVPARGFDGYGNYTVGIKEHIVFPEIDQDSVSQFYGLAITIQTTATNAAHTRALLEALGLPIEKQQA